MQSAASKASSMSTIGSTSVLVMPWSWCRLPWCTCYIHFKSDSPLRQIFLSRLRLALPFFSSSLLTITISIIIITVSTSRRSQQHSHSRVPVRNAVVFSSSLACSWNRNLIVSGAAVGHMCPKLRMQEGGNAECVPPSFLLVVTLQEIPSGSSKKNLSKNR